MRCILCSYNQVSCISYGQCLDSGVTKEFQVQLGCLRPQATRQAAQWGQHWGKELKAGPACDREKNTFLELPCLLSWGNCVSKYLCTDTVRTDIHGLTHSGETSTGGERRLWLTDPTVASYNAPDLHRLTYRPLG